jgi:outer membrane protein TolC
MKSFAPMLLAVVAAFCLHAAASAQTQQGISDERLQELIREAQKATQPTFEFTARVPEGPTVPITLQQAIDAGLERNLDLAVQRLTPQLQDIAIAAAGVFYQPTLTSSINRSSTTTTPTSQLNLATGGGSQVSNNLSYNATVNQRLPWWGAAISGQFQNGRSASNSNNATFNPQYNSTWTAQYSQPLLRGREIDADRRGLIVSRLNRDVSDITLRQQISNLSANIRNAYWNFVYATQAVETAQQSLQISSNLVRDNKIKVEVGTMAPIDVVQAEAEEARMRQSLVQAQNTRRSNELTLKQLIVGGTDDPLWAATLEPVDRPNFQAVEIDTAAAIRRALDERNDIAIVRKQIEMNDLGLKLLRDNTLPDIDFSLSYGVQGVGGTRLERAQSGVLGSSVTQVIPGGIGDAYSQLLRAQNPRWTVGVNVAYPIGLTAQDTSLARARVQLNQAASQLKALELRVATDITSAAINLRNAAEAVEVARVSRELQEQRLQAEQSKFEVGMSTNFQVVQAQRDLNEQRNSELRAILNYQQSQVEFDRVQQNGAGVNFVTIN